MAVNGQTIVTKLTLDNASFKNKLSESEKLTLKFSAAVTGLAGAVAGLAAYTANWQDATIKMARAAGTTSETFSSLALAAEKSNVSTEDLSKSLKKLAVIGPDTAKGLMQIGVSAKDSTGKYKSLENVFGDVAEKVKTASSETQKLAIAQRIFGEEGGKVVNLLKDGKAGLAAYTAEAENMGLIVSTKAGEAAEKFNDSLTDTKNSIKGLVSALGESFIAWSNQGGIMDTVRAAIQGITQYWRGLSDETKSLVITIGAVTAGLAILVAGLIAFKALAPLIGSAFTTAFGPVGLIITGIGLLIAGVTYALTKYGDEIMLVFEPVKRVFSEIAKSFAASYQSVKDFFSAIVNGFAGINEGADTAGAKIDALGTAVKFVFGIISIALQSVGVVFRSIGNQINYLVQQMIAAGKVVKMAFTGDWAGVKSSGALFEKNTKDFTDKSAAIWNGYFADVKKTFASLGGVYEKEVKKKLEKKPEMKGVTQAVGSVVTEYSEWETAIRQINLAQQGMNADGTARLRSHARAVEDIAKAYAAVGQKVAGFMNTAAGAAGGLTDALAEGIKATAALAVRDLDVMSIRSQRLYEQNKEAMTREEDAKIAKLTESYDSQISALKYGEETKVLLLQKAAADRDLALDTEYQSAVTKLQEKYAFEQEQARINFENEKMLMLEKAYDKEQRLANEDVMDAAWLQRQRDAQAAHDKAMADFAKGYADNKKGIENSLKLEVTKITDASAKSVKQLEAEKNESITKATEEKNAKLKSLEEQNITEQKKLEREKLQIQYDAESQAFEQTKAVKIAETVASSIAAAAGAFAALAPIPFVGIGLGIAAAATITAAMGVRLSNLESTRPVKPAALIAETGGLLSGPSHSMGGIDVNAEGGELIVNRGLTAKLFDAIESDSLGGGVTVNFYEGSIRTNDDRDLGEKIADAIGVAIRREGLVGA